MGSESNPYRSPDEQDTAEPQAPFLMRRATRWRLVPTMLFGVLGVACVLTGLSVLGLLCLHVGPLLVDAETRVALARTPMVVFASIEFSALLGAGGCAWLVSARWFWRRRFKAALAVGIALLVAAGHIPPP